MCSLFCLLLFTYINFPLCLPLSATNVLSGLCLFVFCCCFSPNQNHMRPEASVRDHCYFTPEDIFWIGKAASGSHSRACWGQSNRQMKRKHNPPCSLSRPWCHLRLPLQIWWRGGRGELCHCGFPSVRNELKFCYMCIMVTSKWTKSIPVASGTSKET